MSWIEDAEDEAIRLDGMLKQRTLSENKQREKLLKEEKREFQESLRPFHRATSHDKFHIELVLSEAVKNGLVFEGPKESWHPNGGDFLSQDHGHGYDDGSYDYCYWGWSYCWTVTDPKLNLSMTITLGVNCVKKDYWIFGYSLEMTPTVTASQIERQIKSWLVENRRKSSKK